MGVEDIQKWYENWMFITVVSECWFTSGRSSNKDKEGIHISHALHIEYDGYV